MTTRGARGAQGVLTSSFRVFDMSLGQMFWSGRSVLLAVLAAAPSVVAILARVAGAGGWTTRVSGAAVFGRIIALLVVKLVAPILGVFYGTALIGDEVEARTLTYWFTRPVPRRSVVFGRYLAYLASTSVLVVPSVAVAWVVLVPGSGVGAGRAMGSLASHLGMVLAALVAYGAVFAAVGAQFRRPLLAGLVFAFGWEPAVQSLPGAFRQLSVGYYLQAFAPHGESRTPAITDLLFGVSEPPSVVVSVVALAFITGVALWAAARAVEHREYILER